MTAVSLRYPLGMISWRWRSNDPRLVLLVMGGLFALGGGVMLMVHVQERTRLSTAQRTWQQTQAFITRSQVRSVSDRHGVMYQPDVTYVYQSGGRNYQGIALDPLSDNNYRTSSFNAVQRSLQPYQEGTTVPLYFDPQDPGQSALSLTRSTPPLFLWIGATFLLFGLSGLLIGARWRTKRRQIVTKPGYQDAKGSPGPRD